MAEENQVISCRTKENWTEHFDKGKESKKLVISSLLFLSKKKKKMEQALIIYYLFIYFFLIILFDIWVLMGYPLYLDKRSILPRICRLRFACCNLRNLKDFAIHICLHEIADLFFFFFWWGALSIFCFVLEG